MAIGVFKLTKSQRAFLSIIFLILNMTQVLTGVIMLSLSIYIYVSVAPILYSDRAEICFVFTVIGLCGFNNICCYLFGIKIRWKCLNQAYKKSTRNLVFAWACITFYVVIYLSLLARMARRVYKHVVRTMGHSFYIGITKYLKDETWKISIDKIQYDLECCGSHGHSEWYQVPWLGPHQVNEKYELVKQFRENGSWYLPVIPWSCCKLGFAAQCLHDPLQQVRSQNIWEDDPTLVTNSINSEGCLTKMKIPIRWSLTLFVVLVVINWITQIFIFLILRVLYTSCRNANILSDPDGMAPGWIFGRGDCGYNRGKTLTDIMMVPLERPSRAARAKTAEEERLMDSHDN